MEKLKDKTWTNIRLHYLSTKNLVTLQLDKDWTSCRHLEVHKMSNVCPSALTKYVYITVSEVWINLGQNSNLVNSLSKLSRFTIIMQYSTEAAVKYFDW